jgi:hypothetical protein
VKKIVFGLLALVVIVFLVLLVALPLFSAPENTFEDQCAGSTGGIKEVYSGEDFLLCNGETAKIGDFGLKLLEVNDEKLRFESTFYETSSIEESTFETGKIFLLNFHSVEIKEPLSNGLVLSVTDTRSKKEPGEDGAFEVKENSAVFIGDTGVSLYVVQFSHENEPTLFLEFEGVEHENTLMQNWFFDLSAIGSSGLINYVGEKNDVHSFVFTEGGETQ